MAAMEGHGNRSPVQKLLQAHHLPGLVGQNEWGHRVADLRSRLAGAILTKPVNEPIHCGRKFRPFPLYRLGKGAKLFLQRYVQIAHAPEGIVQDFPTDIRDHGKVPPESPALTAKARAVDKTGITSSMREPEMPIIKRGPRREAT